MRRAAIALILLGLAAAAPPSFAQAAAAGNGGADPKAPDAFAGASRQDFYNVDERLNAMKDRAGNNRRAASELRSIRSFADQRKARHGGELRDWEREVIAQRLNRVEQMLG